MLYLCILSLKTDLIFCMKAFYSVLFIFLLTTSVHSQSDDSLRFQIFNISDLDTLVKEEKELIISASRLSETVDEFSQQIIIIEGEEIRKFGYSTLVDVLKYIPGFKTSQPGNAYQGETFLMRGLLGNEYVKFMINGVPIQPEAVQGMPIGAQLPIRHADRIEIILGASSASYGNDAVAGIINIVMPQVEQPVFAWGDVSAQTPQTSNFNLTLGGKTGKGKNLLTYQLYASSFKAQNVNLLIPTDSILVDVAATDYTGIPDSTSEYDYAVYFSYDELLNDTTHVISRIQNMKRESRYMGTLITYRNLKFNFMSLFRDEASGFGMNPLEQSYNNMGITLGERIISSSLVMDLKPKKRRVSTLSGSYLRYKMLPYSSYFGVSNLMSRAQNYMYSRSTDINLSYQTICKINQRLKINYGCDFDYSFSWAFINYLSKPVENNINYLTSDSTCVDISLTWNDLFSHANFTYMVQDELPVYNFQRINLAPFVHTSYRSKSKKIKIEFGFRYHMRMNSKALFNSYVFDIQSPILLPKIGFIYQPKKYIRMNWSYEEGFRANKSYYTCNNYYEKVSVYSQAAYEKLKRVRRQLKPETIKSWEAGTQILVGEKGKINVNYYGHYMQGKLFHKSYFPDADQVNVDSLVGFGYYNSTSYSLLNTFSVSSTFSFTINVIRVDILFAYEYSKGKEFLAAPNEDPSMGLISSPYRYVPTHSRKSTIDFTYKDLVVSFRRSTYGPFVADIFRINETISAPIMNQKNQNMDILIYKQLFHQLSLFTGVNNVFKTVQSGIPYSGLTTTWNFNPQYGRVYKFGLTFKLN